VKNVNIVHVLVAFAIGALLLHLYNTKMKKPAGG
jgi:hypothetical protein